ncbi:MAG: LuxR C-terminal-related transcriptional regulator [Coriobacteriia bacterium]
MPVVSYSNDGLCIRVFQTPTYCEEALRVAVAGIAKDFKVLSGETFIRSLGYALLIFSLIVSKYLSADLQNSRLLLDLAQNASVIIGVLCCMLVSRRIGYLLSRPSIALCGAVLVSTAFAVVICNNFLHYSSIVVAFFAGCCFGFGCSLVLLSWIEFFSFVSPTAVVIYWAFSSLLTAILYLLFYIFYNLLLATIVCFTPLASYWILRMASKAFTQTTKKKPVRAIEPSSFSRVLLWAGYFVTGYVFAHTFINPNESSLVTCLSFILTLLLIIFFLYHQEVNYALAYRVTLVLMAFGLLCGLLFGISSMVTMILISLSYRIINLLVLLLSTGTARLFKVSSAPLYGYIIIAQCIGSILGNVLNMIVSETILLPVDTVTVVITTAVFMLILIPIAFFPENNFVNQWSLSDSISSSETKKYAIVTVCNRLAKLHHLSDREHDVLILLSQEVPKSQIAKDLFIAPGTVRAHIAHIYQKLNLHSKDDLTVLIDHAILENEILNKVD